MLPSTTHSSFTKSVVMSIAMSKVGVVLCRLPSEKSMDSICGVSSFLSEQNVIKHVVDDNIICLSATQLMHAHCIVCALRNTVQQLLHKNSRLHFSWAMAQAGQSWTQFITRFREQREYKLRFNKIEEIKQRLVELCKSSNTTFKWKDAIFVFPCFVR